VLWRLNGGAKAQSLSAAAQGTNAVPIVFIPIPIPARTLNEACEQLGRKIAEQIRASTPLP
jgi:hypothetical protein